MPKENTVALTTLKRRQKKSTACEFYYGIWVTAFADVAELIMGLSLKEFRAFDDEGRKRVAWGVRGMKCNMTVGKTVGVYTNYTVKSMEFAGYLP